MFVAKSVTRFGAVILRAAVVSGFLLGSTSSNAFAEQVPHLTIQKAPKLVAPKLAAPLPAKGPIASISAPELMGPAWRSAVDAALAPVRETLVLVPTTPAPAPVYTLALAKPVVVRRAAIEIRPLPIVAAPATSTPYDTHGETALLPGLEFRMPWMEP